MIFFDKERKQQEIINGISIIYNNEKGCVDKKLENFMEIASADLFDSEGNKFYQNYSTMNDAMYTVCELADRGIVAIVGPCGPIKDYNTGRYIENPDKEQVGVYIVSKFEKTKSLNKNKKK